MAVFTSPEWIEDSPPVKSASLIRSPELPVHHYSLLYLTPFVVSGSCSLQFLMTNFIIRLEFLHRRPFCGCCWIIDFKIYSENVCIACCFFLPFGYRQVAIGTNKLSNICLGTKYLWRYKRILRVYAFSVFLVPSFDQKLIKKGLHI